MYISYIIQPRLLYRKVGVGKEKFVGQKGNKKHSVGVGRKIKILRGVGWGSIVGKGKKVGKEVGYKMSRGFVGSRKKVDSVGQEKKKDLKKGVGDQGRKMGVRQKKELRTKKGSLVGKETKRGGRNNGIGKETMGGVKVVQKKEQEGVEVVQKKERGKVGVAK